jgi:hypothetical protein
MHVRRFLIPFFAVVAVLAFVSCGDGDDDAVDSDDTPVAEVALETPVSDVVDDPDSKPAGGIDPAEGVAPPAEQVLTGRVVNVDRDGPSVEIVESTIVTGTAATDAARAAGEIGPDEEWDLDFYVVEGERRWVDINPSAAVAVYDCTHGCELVEGTLEHVLSGAPYGGTYALWTFVIGDGGLAISVDEIYMP